MIAPVFIGLVLLNAVALTAIVRPPRAWAVKLALILGVFAFSFTVVHARVSGSGFPRPGVPPDGSTLLSCSVDEPRAVYLWVIPPGVEDSTFGYKSQTMEPKAYRLRYSRALHEDCLKATKAVKQGVHVGTQQVKIGKGRRGPRTPLHFYQLPPPHFQQKERTP